MDEIRKLRYGSKQDIKYVLNTMNTKLLKVLLNVMVNVLENNHFERRITTSYRKKLKPFMETYKMLMNEKVPLKQKLVILKKSGERYIPTFLKILGEDAYDLISESSGKRRKRDCPICGKTDLVRLANHLSQKHKISGSEKKQLLLKQESENHASDKHYDSGDKVPSTGGEGEDDEQDY